jgi:hypothetical protein
MRFEILTKSAELSWFVIAWTPMVETGVLYASKWWINEEFWLATQQFNSESIMPWEVLEADSCKSVLTAEFWCLKSLQSDGLVMVQWREARVFAGFEQKETMCNNARMREYEFSAVFRLWLQLVSCDRKWWGNVVKPGLVHWVFGQLL